MLKKAQKRRLEALRESQKLVAGGPGLFTGTASKLDRKVDDVLDLAEFVLEGDRIIRSRDGVMVTRLRTDSTVSAVVLRPDIFEWQPDGGKAA